jgi:hypothetical protein
VDRPDVSYARSGDVAVAYQVVGEGLEDLVDSTERRAAPGEWRLYAVNSA